jgi:hypothetical protein
MIYNHSCGDVPASTLLGLVLSSMSESLPAALGLLIFCNRFKAAAFILQKATVSLKKPVFFLHRLRPKKERKQICWRIEDGL